jgi:hypothetical protein
MLHCIGKILFALGVVRASSRCLQHCFDLALLTKHRTGFGIGIAVALLMLVSLAQLASLACFFLLKQRVQTAGIALVVAVALEGALTGFDYALLVRWASTAISAVTVFLTNYDREARRGGALKQGNVLEVDAWLRRICLRAKARFFCIPAAVLVICSLQKGRSRARQLFIEAWHDAELSAASALFLLASRDVTSRVRKDL